MRLLEIRNVDDTDLLHSLDMSEQSSSTSIASARTFPLFYALSFQKRAVTLPQVYNCLSKGHNLVGAKGVSYGKIREPACSKTSHPEHQI